ncbi:MAG: hypothetical protein Q9218_006802 [Villophora microphyllina]
MTPVSVRGKKGQKARLRAIREQRARKAPVEQPNPAATSTPAIEPRLSRLESLPLELLESIFLYSQNSTLPGLSLTLCRALSARHLKHLMLRSVFTLPCLAEFADDESKELGKVQSALLSRRWVNCSMIQHAGNDFQATVLASFFKDPTFFSEGVITRCPKDAILGPACPIDTSSPLTIRQFLENLRLQEDVQDVDRGVTTRGRWRPRWTSNTNDCMMLIVDFDQHGSILLARIANTGKIQFSQPMAKFRVASGCEMPIKLLRSPWTRENLDFLNLLKHAGAKLDWESGNSGELADSSLKEAILLGNVDVVKTLSNGRSVAALPDPQETRMGVTFTQEHLRLAILEAGCNIDIVTALTLSNTVLLGKGYSLRDGDIYEWAVDKEAQGDERGKWLLEYMDGLEPIAPQ